MDFRKNFSERLCVLRKKKGVSLAALGEYLSVTDEAVRLLEKGKRSPSFEVLCALASYFDVPLDYLTGHGIFADWDMILVHWDIIQRELSSTPEPLGSFFKDLFEKSKDKIQIVQTLSALIGRIEIQESDGQTIVNFHWKI